MPTHVRSMRKYIYDIVDSEKAMSTSLLVGMILDLFLYRQVLKLELLKTKLSHFTDWTIKCDDTIHIFNEKHDFELSIKIFFTIYICIVPRFIAALP